MGTETAPSGRLVRRSTLLCPQSGRGTARCTGTRAGSRPPSPARPAPGFGGQQVFAGPVPACCGEQGCDVLLSCLPAELCRAKHPLPVSSRMRGCGCKRSGLPWPGSHSETCWERFPHGARGSMWQAALPYLHPLRGRLGGWHCWGEQRMLLWRSPCFPGRAGARLPRRNTSVRHGPALSPSGALCFFFLANTTVFVGICPRGSEACRPGPGSRTHLQPR